MNLKRNSKMYVIDETKCNGCAACMDACEKAAIYLVDNKAEIDQTLCTACAVCVDVCPADAISVERIELQKHQTSMNPSLKQSLASAVKSTAVKLGSTLIPIAISKIGNLIATKLEDDGKPSSSIKQGDMGKGKRFRKQYRGNRKRN